MVWMPPDTDPILDKQSTGWTPPSTDPIVDTGSDIGMLESAGRGALRNFPLAQQATAAIEPGQYSQNLADLTQKAEAAKAANPLSYDAGAVAGAVAPLAIPYVGEALEASPIAGNAAMGAAQGLSDTDIEKNPGEALKQAATGAAIGGGLGGATNALLKGPTEETADYLTNKFGEKADKAVGELGHYSGKDLTELPEKYSKMLGDKGIKSIDDVKQVLGRNASSLFSTFGMDIKPTDSVQTVLNKTNEVVDTLGKAQGKAIGALDAIRVPLDVAGIKDKFVSSILGESMDNPLLDREVKAAEPLVQQFEALEKNPTWANAQNTKNLISSRIKDFSKVGVNEPSRPFWTAYRALRDGMIDSIDNYKPDSAASAVISKNPALEGLVKNSSNFRDLLRSESMMYDFADGISSKAKQLENQGALASWRSAPLGILGYIGGRLLGMGPEALVAGYGGATAAGKYGPQIATSAYRNLANITPSVLSGVKNTIPAELEDYLTKKYGDQ
jgi:hypothetical protein